MIWRKWLVRILVFSILGGMAALGLAYQAWTNPTAMRQQVLETMTGQFPGATVSLDSARLRLLGGITITDLRLARKDDPEKQDFLYVPSGVIYLDKEHLLDGKHAIRKIELTRPRLHVVREKDGKWNLDGVIGPVNLKERVPTVVVHQGTILFEDRTVSTAVPVVEIKDASLTIINDPTPTLNIELNGLTDVAGRVQASLKLDRATNATTGTIDLPGVPLADPLIQRIVALAPEVGSHLRYLKGEVALHTTLDYKPTASAPLHYDAKVELKRVQFTHARLALPLEDAAGVVQLSDGQIPFAHLTAHSGPANLEMTVHDLTPPRDFGSADEPPALETLVRDFDFRVEHLQLTDELLKQLPASFRRLNEPYNARGPLTFQNTIHRDAAGKWLQEWHLTAENLRATYEYFKYPLDSITGTLDTTLNSDNRFECRVNMQGVTEGMPVSITGSVIGDTKAPEIALEITGDDIPLDQKLLAALDDPGSRKIAMQFLPDRSRKPSPEFLPMGLGNFHIYINRAAGGGVDDFKNRYVIDVHHAWVKYDVFPYPLENVSATLDIQPDHWEIREGRGTHKGGEIRVTARSFLLPDPSPGTSLEPKPSGPRQRIQVSIHGNQILLDDADFVGALNSRPNLQQTWKKLAIAGRMTFDAVVVDEPDQPQNIDVSVAIQGCRMCPQFFPYLLEDVSGSIRYVQDSVYLTDVSARHGDSVLTLQQGRVILRTGATGFQQVRLQGIKGSPLLPDAALLRALPEELQAGLEALHLIDPVEVTTDLVISQPPEPNLPLVVWWDGHVDLKRASMRAGLDVTDVTGQLACCGLHNGKTLEKVVGTFLLNDATVLGQPGHNLHGRLDVLPKSPGILRFRDLSGNLFGGTLGGEARIEFGPVRRYDLYLKALDMHLDQFAQLNLGSNADLKGSAMAALHLQGEGGELAGLKGEGRLDVPNGKLYKLPPLLDLVKALGLRVPDGIAFEEAHAAFRIDGPVLHIQQLDLNGNAVSLRGQGTANLDGTDLNLDFNADWGRMNQLFPDQVTDVSKALSDQLLKIKMRGKIGSIKLERVFVPNITEPTKKLFSAGQGEQR